MAGLLRRGAENITIFSFFKHACKGRYSVTSFDRELKVCDRHNTTAQGLIAGCHTHTPQQIHGANRTEKRGKHWGNYQAQVEEEIDGDH